MEVLPMIKNLSILNMRKERKNKLLFIFLCFIFLFTLVLSLKVPVKAYQEGPYSKETIDNITGSYRPDLWYLKDNYLYFTFEHISMLNPNTGLATNFTSYISMGLHSFIFNEPIQYEFYYMGQWMPKTFYEGIFYVVAYNSFGVKFDQHGNDWIEISNQDQYGIRVSIVADSISPVISGETNYITNVDNPVSEATIKSGLSAYDNADGYLPSSSFVKTSDNYTGNQNTIGNYVISYSVSDSSGNTSTVNVNVAVVDVTKPTISGTSTYTVLYNETQSLDTVKNNLSVSDNYDTGLNPVLITDNYTANKNQVGNWTVSYQATDTSGNQSNLFNVTINVIDNIAPVISGTNNYTRVYNNLLELTEIKSKLSANDGYDGNITADITLVSNNYTNNYNVKGEYEIVYSVKDSSNNSTNYTITITVIDNIKPTISGNNTYSSGSKTKLSESTIREGISANDDYDGQLDIQLVEDNYSSSYHQIGPHTIIYKATDSSGNTSNYTVTVTVTDDVPPVIYTNRYFINIDGALNYTLEQIIDHLVNTGQLDYQTLQYYEVETSNYLSIPGQYEITLTKKVNAPEELDDTIIIKVNVFDPSDNLNPNENENNNTGLVDPIDDNLSNDDSRTLIITIIVILIAVVILLGTSFYIVYRGKRRRKSY
jgi:hypothetical protein